jgi:hypothetical protein
LYNLNGNLCLKTLKQFGYKVPCEDIFKKGVFMAKKKWSKPKLVVLIRPRTEEVVLQECKTRGRGGDAGDTADFRDCGAARECYDCNWIVSS